MDRILVLNGPNLNFLGKRKPEIYGSVSLIEVIQTLISRGQSLDCEIEACQSNHEGVLIDQVQQAVGHFAGIILNAGGLTHTSVSLRDAVEVVADLGVPTIEVHVSNIHSREVFRQYSFLTDVCVGQVVGMGPFGYVNALEMLHRRLHPKLDD